MEIVSRKEISDYSFLKTITGMSMLISILMILINSICLLFILKNPDMARFYTQLIPHKLTESENKKIENEIFKYFIDKGINLVLGVDYKNLENYQEQAASFFEENSYNNLLESINKAGYYDKIIKNKSTIRLVKTQTLNKFDFLSKDTIKYEQSYLRADVSDPTKAKEIYLSLIVKKIEPNSKYYLGYKIISFKEIDKPLS